MADDPTGRLITMTRELPGLAGVTVRGKDRADGDAPPLVQVLPIVITPLAARAGVNEWRHAFRCYGPKLLDGDRQANALAIAVMQGWANHPPFSFPAPDQPGRQFGAYQVLFESLVGPLEDPQTGEPYSVVTLRTLAPLTSWPV